MGVAVRLFTVVAALAVTLPAGIDARAASAPSAARLRTTLLTVAQAPTGLRITGNDKSEDGHPEQFAGVSSPKRGCTARLRALDSAVYTPYAHAGRSFQSGSGSDFYYESLDAFTSATAAARLVRAIGSTMLSCNVFSLPDGDTGGRVQVRVSRLTWRAMGDQSVAFTTTTTAGGTVVTTTMVLVRRGRVVLQAEGDTTRRASPPLTHTLAVRALAKLDRLGVR